MNKILQVKNLAKIYDNGKNKIEAIKDISFSVNEGEFIAIVGSSGCGKSTLLSILANLEDKTSGEITFSKPNFTIGYMLQEDALLEWKNIKDNALLGLEIMNKKTEDNIKYVNYLLENYGLEQFINKYPKELSGGMKQRVALIRTLAIKPDLLLLDEPFSALDYQTRLAVSNDVYNIIKKEKKTAIMVTHDLAEAICLADKVIVLSKRPSTVKKIYDINLTNKSNPIKNRQTKEFPTYYDKIWKDLDVTI